MTDVQGFVEDGWGKVADAFQANFEGDPGEVGVACAVYAGGRPVVDLWGGLADRETSRPWEQDTISLVASTTKGATAICAHLLVQRGELDLDAPVAQYWPEFAQAGKEEIPVRLLLSHQAGLPFVDAALTFEDLAAWEPAIRALEAQAPAWTPGTQHTYHAVSYGYLVGEVVRRVSGKSLGTFFADEVATPLGLRSWIGLPEEQEPHVATVHYAAPLSVEEMIEGMVEVSGLDADTVNRWMSTAFAPDGIQMLAGNFGGYMATADFASRAYRAMEFPAGNMFTDARSLARMYGATVGEVDGVRLLDAATLDRATEVQTDKSRMAGIPDDLDVPADRSFNMSLGFWRACPPLKWAGPKSFGHPGSGGSVAFGEPDAQVGFGYVTNLWSFRTGEPRAQNLADAVVACLG